MGLIDMVELRPCPFCGADARMKWVLDDHAVHNGHGGKSLHVSCSRDGECPSPSWAENADEHEDDAALLDSVSTFWNTRAEDWEPQELNRLRVKLVITERELIVTRRERDRAIKACEQIADAGSTREGG